jgi:hypothetical protein
MTAYQKNPTLAKLRAKEWRRLNPEKARQKAREGQKKVRARCRQIMDDAKQVPCMDCGKSFDPVCMDFDHRPGTQKSCDQMLHVPLSKLKEEMAKCDVVCACCHRLRTKNRKA